MSSLRSNQRGVALFLALFALLIVTALALGMMYLADTETSINGNYRDDQAAFYAARAGLEEARDRMRSNAGSGISISGNLPTALPGAANGVLYILNPSGGESVSPWTPTTGSSANKYFDDEICLEVNCSGGQVPPTSGWYITPTLSASSSYASNPVLPYKWMRLNLKTNRSAAGTASTYYVNGSSGATSA